MFVLAYFFHFMVIWMDETAAPARKVVSFFVI